MCFRPLQVRMLYVARLHNGTGPEFGHTNEARLSRLGSLPFRDLHTAFKTCVAFTYDMRTCVVDLSQ